MPATTTMSSTLFKLALAAGGMILVLLVALSLLNRDQSGEEPILLADGIAGHPVHVLESPGDPTVWVSGTDASDPRPGGKPAPTLCRVSGAGAPEVVAPEDDETAVLGETTLYPVGTLRGLQPPADVTCSGEGLKHVYVGHF
ncbi:hypothetical protein [Janibacter sp. G1551]|uniref:hypothetical protein n=1 Tax=Janibacter sp. G1551 TaxID=3420440 RepID=UPI003D01E2E7